MKPMNLSDKLSLLIVAGVILSVGVLGLYFDGFLKENYLNSAQKRIQHGFFQLNSDLTNLESELKKGINFVQTDEPFLASIGLVNNYQDKQRYNAILLDEEKKRIAQTLLDKVKFSLNNDIALYDRNEELIAYVFKKPNGFCLNFISYDRGDKMLYRRCENEKTYTEHPYAPHPLIHFRHTSYYTDKAVRNDSFITYHLDGDTIIIRSHRDIVDAAGNIEAHIEMSHMLGDAYFKKLSDNLGLSVTVSHDPAYADTALRLRASISGDSLTIMQNATDYIGVASHPTFGKDVYLIIAMNKAPLTAALDDNRRRLLVIMAVVIGIVLLVLRFIMHKNLVRPLDAMMKQIRKIETQDYSTSEPLRTGDELEQISRNVNQLAGTIRERESALRQSQINFKHLSFHDPLTDLPNRRMFMMRLGHAIERHKRDGKKLAVFFFDLDEFKHVNDALSHHVGDMLLKAVAQRLGNTVRSADTIARIGGDEFNVLIEDVNAVRDAEIIAEKMLADFKTPFMCDGHDIQTSASIGIALYPDDGEDAYTLIKHADLAMYQAKDDGRNHYHFFSKTLSDYVTMKAEYISALKSALQGGDGFRLYYQPKISMQTCGIVGVEALVRWEKDNIGMVYPDQFIPLAEETRLIIPLGEQIMLQAFTDFVALRKEGYPIEKISVNVSPVQLIHSDMIKTLKQAIRMTGIRPDQIELEITESYIATDEQETLRTLQRLREMNVDLSIDDFGTGYSSMSYLHKLPVTRLKIDKSFVEHLPDSAESVAVVKAIIAMAKTFNLSITAEGVETDAQLAFLKAEHCDEIQGYYFSKPLSLQQLKALYEERALSSK
jgi:diguanylate cyclase (GGDEF)-like protein